MKKSLCVLMCILAVASARAADGPGLIIAPDGYTVITIVDGKTVTQKVDPANIIWMGTPTPEPPPPGDGPPPTPLPPPSNSFTKKVTDEAKKANDPAGAEALKMGYTLLKEQVGAGRIPPDATAVDTVMTATLDMMLGPVPQVGGVSPKDRWKSFRDNVSDELGKRLISNNGVLTKAQYVSFFAEVETGLSVANAGYALPPWLLEILLQLVPIIINLITSWLGGLGMISTFDPFFCSLC